MNFTGLRFRTRILPRLAPVLLSALAGLLSPAAHATDVPPGSSVPLAGTTLAASPRYQGKVVHEKLHPFEIRNHAGHIVLQGNYQDRVLRSDDRNTVVFAPRILDLVSPDGSAFITGLKIEGYAGISVDTEYLTDSAGHVGPNEVRRSGGVGADLFFRHDPAILTPPQEQRLLSILTNDSSYALEGRVTIFAQEELGARASVFEAIVEQTAVPAKRPEDLDSIREHMPGVILNKLLYDDGDELSARVRFMDLKDIQDHNTIVFVSPETGDVEPMKLDSTEETLEFESVEPLTLDAGGAEAAQRDGILQVAPGEIFLVLYAYKLSERTERNGEPYLTSDFGMVYDPGEPGPAYLIEPAIALDPNEAVQKTGTLLLDGGATPLQTASHEILFRPRQGNQFNLEDFEATSGAKYLESDADLVGEGQPQWYRYEFAGEADKIRFLPQMRALVGHEARLVASNSEALALFASALELWLEGYRVALNPRLQFFGPLRAPEHPLSAHCDVALLPRQIDSMEDPNEILAYSSPTRMQDAWAFMAMWDFDENQVPVAFIDSGFAPNPDFRSPLVERNLDNRTSGPGVAAVPQAVGNSFFGDKTWHGSGVVTTAGGVWGNRFGAAGSGGQVVRPMLYHMGLRSYAFEMGAAIRLAVNDGAALINLSAGYPCRILWTLGPDDICTPAGRAELVAKLSPLIHGAANLACLAAAVIPDPIFVSIVCATIAGSEVAAALAVFDSLFGIDIANNRLGDLRAPMTSAVAFAISRGVPIVASAGNRLNPDKLGPLAPFVDISESRADRWQIVPATIPAVIAVGAASSRNTVTLAAGQTDCNCLFRNEDFFGPSVDLWAPVRLDYYAPCEVDIDPSTVPIREHRRRDIGATSGAAALVTGIIANVMAIDPQLNPLTASGSLATIPARLDALLTRTSVPASALPSDPNTVTIERGLGVGSGTETVLVRDLDPEFAADITAARRPHLVDSYAAVLAASRAVLFDFTADGYDDAESRLDNAPDDFAAPGLVTHRIGTVTASSFRHSGGLPGNEVDVFRFEFVGGGDFLYSWSFQVRIPHTEHPAALTVNGMIRVPRREGNSWVYEYVTPVYFDATTIDVLIDATGGEDVLYQLEGVLLNLHLPPDPDPFDQPGARNDDQFNPARLGSGTSAWTPIPRHERTLAYDDNSAQICLDGLNFDRRDDEDWFEIAPPPGEPLRCTGTGARSHQLEINLGPAGTDASIEVYYNRPVGLFNRLTLIKSGRPGRPVTLDCADFSGRFPLLVKVSSDSNAAQEYTLKLRWWSPNNAIASVITTVVENQFEGIIPRWERYIPAPWHRLDRPRFLDPVFTLESYDRGWLRDQLGRVQRPEVFLFEVPQLGQFESVRIAARLESGASLDLALWNLDGEQLATASSDQLKDGQHEIAIIAQGLEPGTYFMTMRNFRPGESILLLPSQNIVAKESPGLEAFQDPDAFQFPPALLGAVPDLPDPAFLRLLSGPVPPEFRVEKAFELTFEADADELYLIEEPDGNDHWKQVGFPILEEEPALISRAVGHSGARVRKILGDGITPSTLALALRLTTSSAPGRIYQLEISPDGQGWQPVDDVSQGDGFPLSWLVTIEPTEMSTCFFHVVEK